MTDVIGCPNQAQWQALLNDPTSASGQTQLIAHLETCEVCQQKVDALNADRETNGDVHRLGRWDAPAERGLQEALAELKSDSGTRDYESRLDHDDDVGLTFLSPPESDGQLGRLGEYSVLEVIGRGGMGVVLKAIDPQLQRVVAVKVMAPQLAASPAARQRFLRGARAAASIRHEHVIDVHAVAEANGLPYLVMEYVGGMSLEERLAGGKRLGLVEIVRIGMQTAAGLDVAHAQGLVHRDIKPANILLENGLARVKITDFGLARAAADPRLTRSGVVAGTPEYMAPEQARGESVDARADLFSLGSVLYAMCTGHPPFRADSPLAVLKRVCEGSPPAIRNENPEIPLWLCDIIDRLLAKDPADRFQSAGEVEELLGRHLAHLEQPSLMPLPPRVRSAVQVRRWRRIGIVAGCILLALVVGPAAWWAPTIYRFATNQGLVTIETDDPDVEVTIKDEGDTTTIVDKKSGRNITLKAGEYRVELAEGNANLTLSTSEFTLQRGDKAIVRVRLGPPVIAEIRRFEGHKDYVYGAAFCLDGRCVISGGGGYLQGDKWEPGSDFDLRLWDVKTGRELQRLKGHRSNVGALAVSPDGRRALTVGGSDVDKDYAIRVWDLEAGKELRRLEDHTGVEGLAWLPDGHRAVSGDSGDGEAAIRLWDVETGKVLRKFEGHTRRIRNLAVSADGHLLLSGSVDGTARLWDVDEGKELRRMDVPAKSAYRVALSLDGKLALCAGESPEIFLCNAKTGKVIRELRGHTSSWIDGVAFTPDGRRALSAGGWVDNSVRLWDVESGREICRFEGHEAPAIISNKSISADGRRAVSCGWDKTVRLLELPPPGRDAAGDRK